MMENTYGLLIDYEYCTGCQSCEVACKEEHGYPVGTWGIRVFDDGPWGSRGSSRELEQAAVPHRPVRPVCRTHGGGARAHVRAPLPGERDALWHGGRTGPDAGRKAQAGAVRAPVQAIRGQGPVRAPRTSLRARYIGRRPSTCRRTPTSRRAASGATAARKPGWSRFSVPGRPRAERPGVRRERRRERRRDCRTSASGCGRGGRAATASRDRMAAGRGAEGAKERRKRSAMRHREYRGKAALVYYRGGAAGEEIVEDHRRPCRASPSASFSAVGKCPSG